jgi:hypothetical protein
MAVTDQVTAYEFPLDGRTQFHSKHCEPPQMRRDKKLTEKDLPEVGHGENILLNMNLGWNP